VNPDNNKQNLFNKLKSLDTEKRNEATQNIDVASPLEIARLINEEDKKVAYQVEKRIEQIAQAISIVDKCFEKGGRLIYVGAGTSGRLGVLDAAECPPTFGTPYEKVVGLIAGGKKAMFKAEEGAEDRQAYGVEAVTKIKLTSKDVLCGIAASGRTPYVIGALKEAKRRDVATIFVCTVPVSQIDFNADIVIDIPVGSEVIMGSTRMKSATAQKMVLNMITTGAMIRQGKVLENVMVDLQMTNNKLKERSKRIVMMFTDLSYNEAEQLLNKAGGHVKTALVMAHTDSSKNRAKELLAKHNGFVRKVLEASG